MDSYTLINKLRKARRKYVITAAAQGLYLELIAVNNEEGWSDVFKSTNLQLCAAMNVEEKNIIKLRNELVNAKLLNYLSGKSRREPGQYSLNGYPLGCSLGCENDSQEDSQYDSLMNSPMGIKTGVKMTDLNKHKTKSKTETKTFIEADDNTRAAKIEKAVEEFCNPIDIGPEKEKNVAPKKERVLPLLGEAIKKIADTANWRNVLQQKIIPDDLKLKWDRLDPMDQQIYYQEREDLFEEFYNFKEDNYLVAGLPTWTKMAENFYYWVEIQKNKDLFKKLKGYANGHTVANSNAKPTAAGSRDQRNSGVEELISQSESFLQQYPD